MKIAVTGGSGHLGVALILKLLKEGHRVTAFMRSTPDWFSALFASNVEVVEGDVLSPDQLRRAFEGVEGVFHLAGVMPLTGDSDAWVEKVNVDGVRHVVDACVATGVRRMVNCSSIHAFHSDGTEDSITETTPLVDVSSSSVPIYDRTKAAGQMVAEESPDDLEVVSVQPTGVIGPFDFRVSPMGGVLRKWSCGQMPMLVQGGIDWVDVRDVADGMLAALHDGTPGESYILGGHYTSIGDLARMVGDISGVPRRRLNTPMWLARATAPAAVLFSKMAGNKPVYTPESLLALRRHQRVDYSKAVSQLGYSPLPLSETLSDTIRWYRRRESSELEVAFADL